MPKPGILIIARASSSWIGGTYYNRNVAFQLSLNEAITNKFNLFLLTDTLYKEEFEDLPSNVTIITKHFRSRLEEYLYEFLFIYRNNIRFIYPRFAKMRFTFAKSIGWLADFQHNLYPEYFSEDEYKQRCTQIINAINNNSIFVLSSNNCKNDLLQFYERVNENNVHVMPFVSYIEPQLRLLNNKKTIEILQRYGLHNTKYVYIGNQFWKHKNHVLVLESIKKLVDKSKCKGYKFVFTGMMNDYRNQEYLLELDRLLNDKDIKAYVVNLGFIGRLEQIAIMKGAEFVIQPSLCEGWGTVLEDAKVLDKTVLLSDIPVHREQINEKCILFDPHDASELADIIEREIEKQHIDNVDLGLKYMYEKGREYSMSFLDIIRG